MWRRLYGQPWQRPYSWTVSPPPGRPPKPVTPKPITPRPVKPWKRVEAGRYRSSDERFTLASDGGGRWFVTDEAELDDLGLARTIGPFATLDAAKAATGDLRSRPATTSPLAARLAETASRSRRAVTGRAATRATRRDAPPQPAPPPRTWLDDLADRDPEAARRAHRLLDALAEAGLADADALVRRDTLGDTPAIAARLLARDLVTAVARLQNPRPADVVEAVAAVLAGPPTRDGLPGWELVERAGPGGRMRRLRLVADDLR
jgi:hypothetical protein